ncbi:hypothetical protein PVAG01_05364 [Phlyctema vagabunda]|uniref:Uncharacterized protein n=1 Tax=Phlyctema vagabunda TaxID=108571 RepID=A0ABR4PJV1_9HELO
MADLRSDQPAAPRSTDQYGPPSGSPPAASSDLLFPPPNDDLSDELSDETEGMEVPLTNEDAQSLVGPAISRAATRIALNSAQTPAAEKAAAMEELEGGGMFDSEPESPTLDMDQAAAVGLQPQSVPQPEPPEKSNPGLGLSLGSLPAPSMQEDQLGFPSPWQAGPKVMQRSEATQSALQTAFGKRRSLSGGADTLKKLIPKSFPTMAQARNYFSSAAFGSGQRSPSPSRSPREPAFPRSPGRSMTAGSPLTSAHQSRANDSTATLRPEGTPPLTPTVPIAGSAVRPKAIRRVTSDDSLLYHSLSRTSSLGDDTRFENHHEQVNSRVKAIRDSLQDRSSFRMPQMPQIIPGNITKKLTATPNHTATPRVAKAADPRSDATAHASSPNINTSDGDKDILERAMESLTGDIVIMGGYRGSILRSAKPPYRQLWVPVKVGLNIRKVDLEVGLDPEDEERMEKSIFSSGMLQNIGPVDISKRLFKRLRDCENAKNGKLRIWDYGYDWRLSPHLLSRKLTAFLENLPSNQPGSSEKGALVVAHSLGGLITRHVCNQRPELFSGIVYAGVPQSCVNILGPFRNGDAVLLSSRVLTAQVNFTLRTSFVLLPENGSCFVDITTKEKYPVDFFNIDDWIKYRLSPCTDPPLPPFLQSTSGIGSLLNISGSLLSLPSLPGPGKKGSSSGSQTPVRRATVTSSSRKTSPPNEESHSSKTSRAADVIRGADGGKDRTLAPQMGNNSNPVSKGESNNSSVSTAVTIPRAQAIAYLERTLAETKQFKRELRFDAAHAAANRYPPLAVIYGKGIPTCCGAKVYGRASIPCSDVYDNLAFASGDGVCLAKEAMLPDGYLCARGGRIRSDRGHVTLLGDLNAVGRGLEAVMRGRGKGIGLGGAGSTGEVA